MTTTNFRQTDLVATRAGLQIGRCYIKPAIPVHGDAVQIQSALLAKRNKHADQAVNIALALGVIVVILSICLGAPI
jgi:hypothetical protein